MSFDHVDVLDIEQVGPIVTLTLRRPEVRNALNAALRRAIWSTMAALDTDDSVDVVVLTGADPAFCAGIDLKELGATDGGLSDRDEIAISGGARAFPEMSKPVIGAINGVAVTGGFELALACDFLIASELARFADTHARVGIQPGWGLTVALPQAVGLRRARELSFTGNYLDAQRAKEWGLVNHVVPHEELLEFTHRLASEIATNDRDGVARIRRTYAEGSLMTTGEALDLEGRVSAEWMRNVAGADVESRRAAVIERGRSQVK